MTPGVAPATTGTRTLVPRARARSTPSSRRPVGVVTNPPWRVAPTEPDGPRTLWRFPTPLLAALAAPPPALALLETGDGTYLSDLQVAGATSATLALLAVASLASGTRGCAKTLSGLSSELRHRLDHVEPLEVRLDVTTLWCFVLARDLCTPPPGGWQLSLGFDAQDVERIFRVVASGAELTLFWLACGFVAGQFTRDARRVAEFNGEPYVVDGSNVKIGEELKWYLRPGWQVAFAAGTAWQIAEAYSNAYVSAAANASVFLFDDSSSLLAPAACVDAASALPSVLALAAAMQTYRLFSFYVP
jgi:hypothetical protein